MVDLGEQKANSLAASGAETMSSNDLREERKRNGRYIATVAAIFGSVLAIYHFLTQGSPQYAAIFLPAFIMFVYVFWVLNVSKKSRKKNAALLAEQTNTSVLTLNEVKIVPEFLTEIQISERFTDDVAPEQTKQHHDEIDDKIEQEQNIPEGFMKVESHQFCRTYSVG